TEQVEDFLARVPDHVVVAIDEAYREFHDPATVLGTAGIFRRHGNVVLLRTFSKLQGLAGLRIGYAVAHPRLARALSQVTLPFGASIPAQAAALASLEPAAQEALEHRAEWARAARARSARPPCRSGRASPRRPRRWRAWSPPPRRSSNTALNGSAPSARAWSPRSPRRAGTCP